MDDTMLAGAMKLIASLNPRHQLGEVNCEGRIVLRWARHRIRRLFGQCPQTIYPSVMQPMLLHIMQYYSHYGHRDFICAWAINKP